MHPAIKPQLNSDSPREIGSGDSSRFREIVVAGLRAKQLLRGSKPRIDPDPTRRKYTTIAVEEVRRGLISFTTLALSKTHQSTTKDAGKPIPIIASDHDAFTGFNAGEGP